MAVNSTMLALGTPAPSFALAEPLTGSEVSSADFSQPALLVMFICNHCPYVKHVRSGLVQLRADYSTADLGMVAISANDPGSHPGDAPERIAEEAQAQGYRFPYLFDETQETALAYTAACTPDFFLFGPDRRLVYRGRLDGSRPDSGVPVTGEDLRRAIDAVLAGRPAPAEQYPSMGCSIKWRPGNAPAYA
ncbi:MAG: thioredoxin family protein [Acidimicrobiia bacterium]|jgi:peroxiredoxin|nr:thioredoxin family protein [Acidimicrobiia bacterium]